MYKLPSLKDLAFGNMGTEGADDKPVPEEEVLSWETRDAKEPFGKLLTLDYTSHSVTFRNKYMVTVPELYDEIGSPEHAATFVLNTPFLEPLVCRYWFKSNKATLLRLSRSTEGLQYKTFMGTKCARFQPPAPDNKLLILQMPYQKGLGESTEVILLFGNVVIETELEVTFHSVPGHVAPENKEVYIGNNCIDLVDYKGENARN
ncbi:unnamed protein product [Hymenolepis diminuta]|uniref:DUF5744 domain-containing protein n=1 Tax=Hymenolepis diminuta TaxID=6216 RepID=A0A564YLR8_HYMDI|nr:unnamed protein product [Hymenolepis diminuta]